MTKETLKEMGITRSEWNMNYWMNDALKNSKYYTKFKDESYIDRAVSSLLYAEDWLSQMLKEGLINIDDYGLVHDTLSSTIIRICRS